MNKSISFLLAISGIGVVAFLLWEVLKSKPSAPLPNTASTGSANGYAALFKGFGNLFGQSKSTDNTGALITAGAGAVSSITKSVASLFPTGGTPVTSPALTGGSDFSAGQDPSGFN